MSYLTVKSLIHLTSHNLWDGRIPIYAFKISVIGNLFSELFTVTANTHKSYLVTANTNNAHTHLHTVCHTHQQAWLINLMMRTCQNCNIVRTTSAALIYHTCCPHLPNVLPSFTTNAALIHHTCYPHLLHVLPSCTTSAALIHHTCCYHSPQVLPSFTTRAAIIHHTSWPH